MATKWFITVNAKSKGYVTSINHSDKHFYNYNKTFHFITKEQDSDAINVRPNFTKQTALAPSFGSEAEAQAHVDGWITAIDAEIKRCNDKLQEFANYMQLWDTATVEEKYEICAENNHFIRTHDPHTSYRYGGYGRVRTKEEIAESIDLQNELFNIDWDGLKRNWSRGIRIHTAQKELATTKLMLRECECEIKFMDKECRTVKWELRGDNETRNEYCNCCGAAIPSVYQLTIGGNWGKNSTVICVICINKLQRESEQYYKRIPQDILDQYTQDRFLRALD